MRAAHVGGVLPDFVFGLNDTVRAIEANDWVTAKVEAMGISGAIGGAWIGQKIGTPLGLPGKIVGAFIGGMLGEDKIEAIVEVILAEDRRTSPYISSGTYLPDGTVILRNHFGEAIDRSYNGADGAYHSAFVNTERGQAPLGPYGNDSYTVYGAHYRVVFASNNAAGHGPGQEPSDVDGTNAPELQKATTPPTLNLSGLSETVSDTPPTNEAINLEEIWSELSEAQIRAIEYWQETGARTGIDVSELLNLIVQADNIEIDWLDESATFAYDDDVAQAIEEIENPDTVGLQDPYIADDELLNTDPILFQESTYE